MRLALRNFAAALLNKHTIFIKIKIITRFCAKTVRLSNTNSCNINTNILVLANQYWYFYRLYEECKISIFFYIGQITAQGKKLYQF